MRFIVLLFGFLGCSITAVLGALLFMGQETVKTELQKDSITSLEPALPYIFDLTDKEPRRTAIFLFVAAGLGMFGTLLGFFRCGWQGSLLMFVPLIGPVVMSSMLLAGVMPQAFAAVLSLFVGPLPINPAGDDDDDD